MLARQIGIRVETEPPGRARRLEQPVPPLPGAQPGLDDPQGQEVVALLKRELARLKKDVKDEDQFAHDQPPPGVDGRQQQQGRDTAE